MTATIRRAERQDLPAVRDLLVATWHATYDATLGVDVVNDVTSRWHTVERLAQQLDRPDGLFLVAHAVDGLRATASAARGKDGRVAIERLYVLPAAQGQGLGRRLMTTIEQYFADATEYTLEVEPQNRQAIAFYEALGFRKVGGGTACGGDSKAAIAHAIMTRAAR